MVVDSGDFPSRFPACPDLLPGRPAEAGPPAPGTPGRGTITGMASLFSRNARKNPADSTVTLIGKPGCHLCDVAQEVIERVCAETGASWEKKDITQDEELYRKYWEQIPVVLVDGAQHDFWRVDPQRLRKALGA